MHRPDGSARDDAKVSADGTACSIRLRRRARGAFGSADRFLLRQGSRLGVSFRDTCLACGGAMGPALAFAASLRCHDCRACRAPLRADLVEQARSVDAPGAVLEFPAQADGGSMLAA
jgi:hypothetical protein